MEIKFHNVKQNTDEWFDLKKGLASSSNFACIMANYPKAFGKPAHEYAMRIALEREADFELETICTKDMQHGIDYEPIARERYEQDTFSEVVDGGFFCNSFYGSSPDGLIGDDGLIEIKCPQYKAHFYVIKSNGINTAYRWQIQGQLFVTGRKWCDWVSYSEDFPLHKQLYIHRVDVDENDQQALEVRLLEFETLVRSYQKMISLEGGD